MKEILEHIIVRSVILIVMMAVFVGAIAGGVLVAFVMAWR